MNKIASGLSLVFILGVGISLASAEQKCMYKATIENGQFGAVNLESFEEMLTAKKNGDKNKINELVNKNKIKKIVTDKMICVLSEDFYKSSLRVIIPGYGEYWVDGSKLSLVE